MSTATETKPAEQQGLEKFDPKAKTPEVITNPELYKGALARWKAMDVNVITPFAQIGGLPPMHAIRWSAVQLDPSPQSGDVYSGTPWLKQGEVALAKKGLRAIADGMGLSIKLSYLKVERRYWHILATASYRNIDGLWVDRETSEQLDLNDGADDTKGMGEKQLSEARRHGLRVCEEKAINAVIRQFGLKQSYSQAEIKRPFISMRVSFEPDFGDPDTKRIFTERAASGRNALYAGTPSREAFAEEPQQLSGTGQIAGAGEATVAGARPVGRGSTVPPQGTTPQTTAAETTSQAPVEGAVQIVGVKPVAGMRGNTPWKKWDITDSNGEVCSTFDEKLAEYAEKVKVSEAWVELSVSMNGQYRNLEEIAPAGQQPGLPIDIGNL